MSISDPQHFAPRWDRPIRIEPVPMNGSRWVGGKKGQPQNTNTNTNTNTNKHKCKNKNKNKNNFFLIDCLVKENE